MPSYAEVVSMHRAVKDESNKSAWLAVVTNRQSYIDGLNPEQTKQLHTQRGTLAPLTPEEVRIIVVAHYRLLQRGTDTPTLAQDLKEAGLTFLANSLLRRIFRSKVEPELRYTATGEQRLSPQYIGDEGFSAQAVRRWGFVFPEGLLPETLADCLLADKLGLEAVLTEKQEETTQGVFPAFYFTSIYDYPMSVQAIRARLGNT